MAAAVTAVVAAAAVVVVVGAAHQDPRAQEVKVLLLLRFCQPSGLAGREGCRAAPRAPAPGEINTRRRAMQVYKTKCPQVVSRRRSAAWGRRAGPLELAGAGFCISDMAVPF